MAILLFLNMKGGVAKTTSAVAVAETLAVDGHRVLVIDADHQCAASELLLGEERLARCERNRRTLHDLLADMLDWEFEAERLEPFVEHGASNVGGGIANLSVLPCSMRIEDFSTNMAKAQKGYRSTEEWQRFLRKRDGMLRRWLVGNFDYTIVDCPPGIPLQVRVLLRIADGFVVPSVPDRLSVQGSLNLMERIRRTGIRTPGLGTLWTLFKSQNEVHRRCIVRAAQGTTVLPRPFDTIIPNATAIARASEQEDDPPSLAAKYEPKFAGLYRDLCEEIVARLKESGVPTRRTRDRRAEVELDPDTSR